MTPAHLKGKSAIAIVSSMNHRWFCNKDATQFGYINFLEGLLIIAVKDALCAADGVDDLGAGRACAFLNQVYPDDSTPSQN